MSHSTPEQPTFGKHDESYTLPSDGIAAAELDDLRDRRVYAARLGCVLHILQHILHGPTRQGPVERVGKRSRVLASRPRTVQHEPLRFVLSRSWFELCLVVRKPSPGKGCRGAKGTSRFFLWSRFVLGSRFFFGGRRRSGVHGDARNNDQEVIFDTPVLDGGVRCASSVFCAVCFETQGSV